MNYTAAIYSFNRHQNLLPYCLKSVKKNCKNYTQIVVVWDDYVREKAIDFDEIRSNTGVDFTVVKHTEIYDWPKKIGEWGWVKQQLAKMLCYSYINDERTFIVDSDVLILEDPELFTDNKTVLRYDPDTVVYADYKFFMHKYLGISNFSTQTWVGSTCVFEHDILQYIDHLCTKLNKKNLVETVNHMLENDLYPELPFSEFEIYGHVCKQQYNNRFVIQPKNWTYPGENYKDKIKIMWADDKDSNLEEKYKLLTNSK